MTNDELNALTGAIINAAMSVHSALGPGLLENAYETCLAFELRSRGYEVLVQVPMPVMYRGNRTDLGYRIDLLVNETVIVELKAMTKLHPIFDAQLISYLKLSGYQVGLLINFHVAHLRDGVRRFVNAV